MNMLVLGVVNDGMELIGDYCQESEYPARSSCLLRNHRLFNLAKVFVVLTRRYWGKGGLSALGIYCSWYRVYFLKDSIAPLKIFSYCGTHFQHLDFEPSWASWIPSFSYRVSCSVLNAPLNPDDGSQRPCYDPCGSEISGVEMYPKSIESGILQVYGFPIDTLTALLWPCITLSVQGDINIANKWFLPIPQPTTPQAK